MMIAKSVHFERLSALCTFTLVWACSDAANMVPATGGGGGAAGSASASAGAASGGTNTAGGASPTGGSGGTIGPSSGSGGSSGPAGGTSGSGTSGSGTSGSGTSGSGGSAANGGGAAGNGGNGGAAGMNGDGLLAVAAELDGLRLECPCIDANHFGAEKSDNCDAAPEVDRQTYVRTLGGNPDLTYDVKLRVRGNTEPNTYVGGKLEQERFYIGGQTSTPGYTAYMVTVSEPRQTYFFNHNPTTGHIHFLIDYEVVIKMRGGATVTFEVNGGKSVPDGHGVSNRERLVVPGIDPAPEPFNGQLVQFDVSSVTAPVEP